VKTRQVEVVKELIKKGADTNLKTKFVKRVVPPLHVAVTFQDEFTIPILDALVSGGAEIDAQVSVHRGRIKEREWK
jgi:hypothetical protein